MSYVLGRLQSFVGGWCLYLHSSHEYGVSTFLGNVGLYPHCIATNIDVKGFAHDSWPPSRNLKPGCQTGRLITQARCSVFCPELWYCCSCWLAICTASVSLCTHLNLSATMLKIWRCTLSAKSTTWIQHDNTPTRKPARQPNCTGDKLKAEAWPWSQHLSCYQYNILSLSRTTLPRPTILLLSVTSLDADRVSLPSATLRPSLRSLNSCLLSGGYRRLLSRDKTAGVWNRPLTILKRGGLKWVELYFHISVCRYVLKLRLAKTHRFLFSSFFYMNLPLVSYWLSLWGKNRKCWCLREHFNGESKQEL